MNGFWNRVYDLYCTGREATGLRFLNHGAHQSCTVASNAGIWGPMAAWSFARQAHSRGGNPLLPRDVKTAFGFCGGFVLFLLGLLYAVTGGRVASSTIKLFAFAATILLSQTFWGTGEQISGGGSGGRVQNDCPHINTYISLDTGNEICRDCGTEIVSDPSEGSNNPNDYM